MISKAGEAEQKGPAKTRIPIPVPDGVFFFAPREGITAAEVGDALGAILAGVLAGLGKIDPRVAEAIFVELDEGTRRHFTFLPRPKIIVPGR